MLYVGKERVCLYLLVYNRRCYPIYLLSFDIPNSPLIELIYIGTIQEGIKLNQSYIEY